MIDISVLENAFNSMVEGAIAFFPRFLTAVFVLLIGWLISRIISTIIIRLGQRLKLESLLDRTGIVAGLKRAQIERSGTELLGTFVFWIIWLNFILIALESLGLSAAVEPLRGLIAFLPRLLAALVTLTVGIWLAQFLGKAAEAAMSSMGVDFAPEVGQGVNVLLIIMIVIVVLEQLGIDASIMTNIFTNVITLIVAGLALAFALGGRDVARNVLAGYYAREQFATGDILVIDENEGVLEAIGTMNSEIRVGEERLIIPNTRLTETAVKIINPNQPNINLELEQKD